MTPCQTISPQPRAHTFPLSFVSFIKISRRKIQKEKGILSQRLSDICIVMFHGYKDEKETHNKT